MLYLCVCFGLMKSCTYDGKPDTCPYIPPRQLFMLNVIYISVEKMTLSLLVCVYYAGINSEGRRELSPCFIALLDGQMYLT